MNCIFVRVRDSWKASLSAAPKVSPLPYPLQSCLMGKVGSSTDLLIRVCDALRLAVPPGTDNEPEMRAMVEAALDAAGFGALDRPPADMDEATLIAALQASAANLPGEASNDIELKNSSTTRIRAGYQWDSSQDMCASSTQRRPTPWCQSHFSVLILGSPCHKAWS